MTVRKSRSLADAIDSYIRSIDDGNHTASTIRSYRAELGRFQGFVANTGAGDPPVGTVEFDLVRSFQLHLDRARPTSSSSKQTLAVPTIARRLVVLRQFLRFAWDQAWLSDDLASTLILPRPAASSPRALDRAQLEQLIGSIEASTLHEKRDRAFILMLLSTGASLADVLRLNRSDLRHNELLLGEDGGRQRAAVLTKRARRALESYVDSRKDRSTALFIGLQPARRGVKTGRLTPTGARYVCASVARRLQIPAFSPRQLRHTTGTLLYGKTGDAILAAETLGLANQRSVAVYKTLAQNRRRLARTTLEEEGL